MHAKKKLKIRKLNIRIHEMKTNMFFKKGHHFYYPPGHNRRQFYDNLIKYKELLTIADIFLWHGTRAILSLRLRIIVCFSCRKLKKMNIKLTAIALE